MRRIVAPRHRRFVAVLGALAGLLLAGPPAAADDPPADTAPQGSVTVGGTVSAVEDWQGRVREFDLDREEVESLLGLDFWGVAGGNRYDVRVQFENEKTLDLGTRIDAGPWLRQEFSHRSFWHWLDHDRLENLAWRERVGVDSLGNDVGGGKYLTHEDTDPHAVYGVRWSETRQHLDLALPFVPGNTELSADWRDQRREGTKQVRGVDHCANCHVRSHTALVDEQTRDLTLGVSTLLSDVRVAYKFSARDYDNRAKAIENRFMEARHPVNGGSGAEFQSRLIYDNETLVVSQTPDVEKRSHSVEASVELPRSNSVRSSFTYTKSENTVTGLELKANAAALSWWAPFGRKVRAQASLARREIDNDPFAVDLPLWREGRAGGGQDFDWVRNSAYDREEYLGTARLSWALRRGQTVRLDYRFRYTDRDWVALDPDDPSHRTLQNRVRATWLGRLASRTRARVSAEYEVTDLPFVNVRGICENAQGDELMPLDGNSFVYYFQRERIGTGGNLPTKALRARANVSTSFGPKVSATGWVSVASEKNDDLNLYDFERTSIGPGLSLFVLPHETVALSAGGDFRVIESNAKLCATVMDG